MKTPEEFWSYVEAAGVGCWNWKAGKDTRGYGSLNWHGLLARAHRVAYELTYGDIPRGSGHHGTVVMHTCDNRVCCNPRHLKLGDHAANMADMKAKGRRKGINASERNGRAKLTPEQVLAIRADNRGKRTIAPEFGISPAQVQRIRLGKQWVAGV